MLEGLFQPVFVQIAGAVILVAALGQALFAVTGIVRRSRTQKEHLNDAREYLRSQTRAVLREAKRREDLFEHSWNGIRKFEVSRKVLEAEGVHSLYLAPHDGKPLPPFHPGQFLTFSLRIPNQSKPVIRCYSLSDSFGKDYFRESLIYRTLDRGVQGVVVPHVNTREEAENVVAGGKFAPLGRRGIFPSRQSYGVTDFYRKANDETLLVVLIEDIVAWENLDDIISVEGIDVFFVAPGDFASSMGHIWDWQHREVQEKVDDAISRIVAAGHSAGTLATNETVERYAALGARFFFTVSQPWLNAGAQEFMARGEAGRQRNR